MSRFPISLRKRGSCERDIHRHPSPAAVPRAHRRAAARGAQALPARRCQLRCVEVRPAAATATPDLAVFPVNGADALAAATGVTVLESGELVIRSDEGD